MSLKDSIIALAFPHGEEQAKRMTKKAEEFAWSQMPRMALTVGKSRKTNAFEIQTSHPLAIAQPFESQWSALLPELNLRDDTASMTAVYEDAVQVIVIDTVWGRASDLFQMALRTLRALNPPLEHLTDAHTSAPHLTDEFR